MAEGDQPPRLRIRPATKDDLAQFARDVAAAGGKQPKGWTGNLHLLFSPDFKRTAALVNRVSRLNDAQRRAAVKAVVTELYRVAVTALGEREARGIFNEALRRRAGRPSAKGKSLARPPASRRVTASYLMARGQYPPKQPGRRRRYYYDSELERDLSPERYARDLWENNAPLAREAAASEKALAKMLRSAAKAQDDERRRKLEEARQRNSKG
jgi:hypothetical protein